MRILLDYRPALRQRTGVGEYAHGLAEALQRILRPPDTLTLFSSSWKDRLPAAAVPGASRVDAPVPVRVLNFAWHQFQWPPVDLLSGAVDVTHSQHPLILPSRRGARVVTIHDLYFLDHPEHTTAEIRRDYVHLVGPHARRADAIVVSSEHTRNAVVERLQVEPGRITLCYPGAPAWEPRTQPPDRGPILFLGTLEPRKNLAGLLKAYALLLESVRPAPDLVVAGRVTADGAPGAAAVPAAMKGRVRYPGYITGEERMRLYREASMIVIPSFDEGFGLTALEAMTIGLPVVASRRGSLPEVLGDAALMVEPEDHAGIAAAMRLVLEAPEIRQRMIAAGLARARTFRWDEGAIRVYEAYKSAVHRRRAGA